jgi:hypothetical protein
VLALTLSQLMPQNNVTTSEQGKHLLTSLMFCLGEWCMKMPSECLLASCNGSCLLLTVFKVIKFNRATVNNSVCQSFFLAFLFFFLSFLISNLKEIVSYLFSFRESYHPVAK